MIHLEAHLRVLTPLFLGSADPQTPLLRGPAFKSALRSWYRAVDPEFWRHEARWFGGVAEGEGQSPFRLLLEWQGAPRTELFDEQLTRPWRQNRPPPKKPLNGVQYLAYSLLLPGNRDRHFFVPDSTIRMRVVVLRPDELGVEGRRALLSALWCLGHLGGIGTRSRRGFGSVQLMSWRTADGDSAEWRTDMAALPLLGDVQGDHGALRAVSRGLAQIRSWFPGEFGDARQEHLGPSSRITVLRPSGTPASGPLRWGTALQAGGLALQEFRASRNPDKERVLRHVLWLNKYKEGVPLSGASPERAVFGLPLTFRFIKPEGLNPRETELNPAGEGYQREGERTRARLSRRQRHASPLRLRVIRAGGQDLALFVRMSGALPGASGVVIRTDGVEHGSPLTPPSGALLDQFLDQIRGAVHAKGTEWTR